MVLVGCIGIVRKSQRKRSAEQVKRAFSRSMSKRNARRPSPRISATFYPIGTRRKGKYNKTWKVIRSGRTRRWSPITRRVRK